jgi:Holliday junction resolvase RusA-like endonuclease
VLPDITVSDPPYTVTLFFGFSNQASDIDNPVKCFLDILQAKYGFNDKDITDLHVKKNTVPQGEEYIDFNIF